jgi:hypothetical protein
MMKTNLVGALLLTFIFSGCATTDQTSATAGASWYNTMHRLSANHTALMPYVSNPKEFYDPKNLSVLREKTNEMMKASVEMTKDAAAPNADPMITFTADQFSKDMQMLAEMVDSGKLQPAHYGLSQVGNYCISCHTRADRGSKNFPLPWASDLSNLSTPQKALFYLANRQYDSAHKETEKIIADTNLINQDPSTWMSTIQKDLAVIVRVQEDLPRAKTMIDQILKNKSLPEYMKLDVKSWSRSLSDWQVEEKKSKEGTKNLAFVKKLVDQARSPSYVQGQAAFIIYLRASGILHELLESSRNSPTYSSTLYFAGLTAEALKNVDVWKLGEHYFEVCIENSPNTVISQKCYTQLEALVKQSHPNMNQMPELAKRVETRLAKYKDLSKAQNPTLDKIRPNDSGPRF